MAKKSVSKNITLPLELNAQVALMAREHGRSFSNMVAHILERAIKAERKT